MKEFHNGAKRASIYEVAALAKTSIATVSRAINQPHRVSPESLARVQQAVAELNYVVDSDASLRAKSSHLRIAVVSPLHTFPGFSSRLKGIIQAFEKTEAEIIIFHVDTMKLRERNQVKYFDSLVASGRYDALIVMSLSLEGQFLDRIKKNNFPIVLLETEDSRFPIVLVDHEYGSQIATQHLIDGGHSRLGFLGFVNINNYALNASALRESGFRKCLKENKIKVNEKFIYQSPYGIQSSYEVLMKAWQDGERPNAIVCATDLGALGVLKVAAELNLQVPTELAIIGFDDIDMALYVELSTVRQPLEKSGSVAAKIIQSLLNKEKTLAHKTLIDLELITRKTS